MTVSRDGPRPADARVTSPAAPARSDSASRPRVLVAYDGSEASKRAIERVARLMTTAGVALVTVARPIYATPPYGGYADPEDENEARRLLQAARETLQRDGVAASGYAAVGDAATEILRTESVFEAELIVLGARSLGAAGRLLLGSVSTSVMHRSRCDVLIVK